MRRVLKSVFCLIFTLFLGGMGLNVSTAFASGNVDLYTSYSDISVTPGQEINYMVDVLNHSGDIQTVPLSIQDLPSGWKATLTAGGWSIHQLSIKPNDSQSASLQLDVPLKVEKGTYHFDVLAEGFATLPLTVTVSEVGTFKTELTVDQPNMQGPANSSFDYTATLKNRTAQKQLYSLAADIPQGWNTQFKVDGKAVTSVNVDANGSKDIDISITPPDKIKADTYKIPIKAATGSTSATAELEAAITGSYSMKLSTPNGLLSTDVTAGDQRKVTLQVTNTGSAELKNVNFKADAPVNWEVSFDPKKIDSIAPGKSAQVTATIKADKNAIAGDYVTDITAQTPETSSDASFRVAVKTSLLWGWLGILIIAAVIGGMYYLFRKYGRR